VVQGIQIQPRAARFVAVSVKGIAGYLLRFLDLPTVPMVLGLILGPTAEFYLRNSLSIGNGNWFIFFQRPICVVFMALLVLLVMLKRGSKKEKSEQAKAIAK